MYQYSVTAGYLHCLQARLFDIAPVSWSKCGNLISVLGWPDPYFLVYDVI